MKGKKLKIAITLIFVSLIALFVIYYQGSEMRIKRFLESKYPGYTFTYLKINNKGDRLYSVDGFDAPVTVRLTGEYPLDLNDDFLQVRYERQIFEDDARVFSELAGDDYFFTTLHYVGWCRNGELTCEYMDDNQFEILMPTNDSDMSFEDFVADPSCGLEAYVFILVDDVNEIDQDTFRYNVSHTFGRNNRYYSDVRICITDNEAAFDESIENHRIYVIDSEIPLELRGHTNSTGYLYQYNWITRDCG